MKTDLFDFHLPKERIALRRTAERTASRLLCVNSVGSIAHRRFVDLLDLLRPGDCLALNDTKVIKARLIGQTTSPGRSAASEFTIIKIADCNFANRFLPVKAFAKGSKKFRIGEMIAFGENFTAELQEKNPETGELTLRFAVKNAEEFFRLCDQYGQMPLPPYIASARKPDAQDENDYQTVFAKQIGSVAAPTASLHFDEAMLQKIREKGVHVATLTLHVGAGTFLPVKTENIHDHQMHSEYFILDNVCAERINQTKIEGGRVVAVGTTAMRTLESCAIAKGKIAARSGETDIFITPGYDFLAVDALLTNFHLPRSTLFMLVCAFSGIDVMKRAYAGAITEEYGFFSYGDACFLERAAPHKD